jgi:hypothetical protein
MLQRQGVLRNSVPMLQSVSSSKTRAAGNMILMLPGAEEARRGLSGIGN